MKTLLTCAAAGMLLQACCGILPGFDNPSEWQVTNYQDALSVRFEEGVLRVCGTGKQKDTAWSVTTGRRELPVSGKELSVSVRITSSRNIGKGMASDNQRSAVLWYGSDGKELASTELVLPAVPGLRKVRAMDVLPVPEGAASFRVRLGFDRPNLDARDVVEYSDFEVALHSEAGKAKPGLDLPDMRQVAIERKSASPFEDAFAEAVFTVSDPVGLDWGSLAVSVDGVDCTAMCKRDGGDVRVPPPQGGWSNGLHVATIAVNSVRPGVQACERRAFYRGVAPRTLSVTMRDDGLVMVDGKPYFPIGAFGVRYDSRMPEVDIDKAHENLAAAGFDMSHKYGDVYKSPKRKAAIEKHGFRQWVMARVPDADFLECGRFDPSIVAWYLGDDTSDYESPEELRFYDSAVKAADPTRITVQADATVSAALDRFQLSKYSLYVTGTDVFMPEIYPFKGEPGGERYTNAVAKVCKDMETIRRDVRLYNDGKPRGCWPILQAFVGWGQWKAFPTIDQIYSTTMAAIVHGAQGMTWYTYCGSRSDYGFATSPERWAAMRHTSLRVRELVPVLVERVPVDQPTVAVVSGPEKDPLGAASVTCLMKRHDGATYLFAVNASPSPVTAQFAGLAGCKGGEAKWEDRKVLCKDGTLEDRFAPFEVHVYRFPGGAR